MIIMWQRMNETIEFIWEQKVVWSRWCKQISQNFGVYANTFQRSEEIWSVDSRWVVVWIFGFRGIRLSEATKDCHSTHKLTCTMKDWVDMPRHLNLINESRKFQNFDSIFRTHHKASTNIMKLMATGNLTSSACQRFCALGVKTETFSHVTARTWFLKSTQRDHFVLPTFLFCWNNLFKIDALHFGSKGAGDEALGKVGLLVTWPLAIEICKAG